MNTLLLSLGVNQTTVFPAPSNEWLPWHAGDVGHVPLHRHLNKTGSVVSQSWHSWRLGLLESASHSVGGISRILHRKKHPLCKHRWQKKFINDCPYGWAGPLDVTWPDHSKAKGLGVEIDESLVEGVSPWFVYICIFYSYMLYGVGVNMVWKLIVRRGTRELNNLFYLLSVMLGQELFIKPFIRQPRPEMSCHTSCGMPSSHAAIALGTLTLYLGDAALHSVSRLQSTTLLAPGYFSRLSVPGENSSGSRSEFGVHDTIYRMVHELRAGLLNFANRFDEPSNKQFVIDGFTWLVMMFPVPLSRVALGDHSEQQVCVGAFVGIFVATLWVALTRIAQFRYNHRLGEQMCGIKHNMALPCGVAIRHLCEMTDLSSNEARRVLLWYERETLMRMCNLAKNGLLIKEESDFLKLRWCSLHELMGPLTEEAEAASSAPPEPDVHVQGQAEQQLQRMGSDCSRASDTLEDWEGLRLSFLRAAAIGRMEQPVPKRFFTGLGSGVFDNCMVEMVQSTPGAQHLNQ